ncbi:carboxypeptidase-like regulatory domain-containing protein, partial [Candidatus Latescibacterota bacterium]
MVTQRLNHERGRAAFSTRAPRSRRTSAYPSSTRLRLALLTLLFATALHAESPIRHGTLKGVVLDRSTQRPLVGANILVLDHQLGATADEEGRFLVASVPTGVHRLQVSMIGYETAVRADVVVKYKRITAVEIELEERALGMAETVVTADYFADVADEAVSTVNFSYEEIRRSPGSAGDISRLLQSLPAVNMASDDR